MPSKNFKSNSAYRKWLAYKHINFGKSKEPTKITIRGKSHRVVYKQ